ncbi:MAG: CPBP family intramembrane glutamic endopeptidase [Polyangiaceae bacterium]
MIAPSVLPPVGRFEGLLATFKPLLPIPALLVLLPALCWFFRDTWRELDDEATVWRARMASERRMDHRPFIALATCALVLTLQEYYGGRGTYEELVRPILSRIEAAHPRAVRTVKYDELYGFAWWSFTRVVGYFAPLATWRLWFPEDAILDMGFRIRGFFAHAWIYGLFLALVIPVMLFVSREPDFGAYYPFYRLASRSWFDFLVWEAMYFAQFFALEVFFRGFWLGALRRSFGSGAIFAMAVPYCMIHYGKPFLEANGAIVAGVALGSLSMKTKSIYQGFLVHITVAALMDWLSLLHRHALPQSFWG